MTGLLGYRRILIVTAVEAERAAIRVGLAAGGAGGQPGGSGGQPDAEGGTGFPGVEVVAVGVGPAAAAAGAARLLALAEAAGRPYDAVLCAGIGGGFAGRVEVGGLALATASVAADLGAGSPRGFFPLDELGLGTTSIHCEQTLSVRLRAALPAAVAGPVLTASTVTGTAEGEAAIRQRYPEAVAEAMEGFGAATAAAGARVAFGELRAISNLVGPRDRDSWHIPQALAALRAASVALTA